MTPLRCIACLLLALGSTVTQGQTPLQLPGPTGPDAVGRRIFDWIDTSRHDPASRDLATRRELLVYVWYPAEPGTGVPAPYLEPFQLRAEALASAYGAAWKRAQAGMIATHTRDNAKLATSTKAFPLLIFSPGLGLPTAAYTFVLEDLASHGYIVAAVEHTRVNGPVAFPDGRIAPLDFSLAAPPLAPDDQVDIVSRETRLDELSAADLSFVLSEMIKLGQDPTSPFFSKIAAKHAGVFGHSIGGRIAVRACQRDVRFSACLNQDGTMFWKPFTPDDTGNPLVQPFMMLDHEDAPLPDAAFQQMHTTREAYEQRRAEQIALARTLIYPSVLGGSYEITIRVPDAAHGSFSDLTLLRATAAKQIEHQLRIMALDRYYTRVFFDRYLQGEKLDIAGADNHDVTVTKFAPTVLAKPPAK